MSSDRLSLDKRSSGILLHITSLPGPYGIGDLGPSASQFIQFLKETHQTWWQMLPVGPPGMGDSPYSTFSTFAGNPNLINLEALYEKGWLSEGDIKPDVRFSQGPVPFYEVWNYKEPRLRKAFKAFRSEKSRADQESFEQYCHGEREWLDDYAVYMALKLAHGGAAWFQWDTDVRLRKKEALESAQKRLHEEIEFQKFLQFNFLLQWSWVKGECEANQIHLIGDLPFYVASDSAEVWAHQKIFSLKEDGNPAFVAGVPPDYFSEDGQMWGNVLYRWDILKEQNYKWWINRLKHHMEIFHAIRLDHFLGFQRYWEIPADAKTAKEGWYRDGPGAHFFTKAREVLGDLSIIAEDLGNVTPEMEQLRDQFKFPGMRVLQFAFDGGENNPHLSYSFVKNSVVYTGTHDNNTSRGWYEGLHQNGVQQFAKNYLKSDGTEIHWDFIREAMKSVSNICIIPLQDVLGLGESGRMNIPGNPCGNWTWRFKDDSITPDMKKRLAEMTQLYAR